MVSHEAAELKRSEEEQKRLRRDQIQHEKALRDAEVERRRALLEEARVEETKRAASYKESLEDRRKLEEELALLESPTNQEPSPAAEEANGQLPYRAARPTFPRSNGDSTISERQAEVEHIVPDAMNNDVDQPVPQSVEPEPVEQVADDSNNSAANQVSSISSNVLGIATHWVGNVPLSLGTFFTPGAFSRRCPWGF